MQNAIRQRIKQVLEIDGRSVTALARQANGNQSTFNNQINQNSSIDVNVINAVLDQYPTISAAWLLRGEGKMYRNEAKEGAVLVPLIDVSAQAGSLTAGYNGVTIDKLDKVLTPIPDAEMAIDVRGDSMAPDYPSGSRVFCKAAQANYLVYGNAYVLDTDDGIILKRVYRSKQDNAVECRSINPLYEPFDIPLSSIYRFWIVLGVFTFKS